MPESAFYLGRLFDLNTSRLTSQPFFYDPADLTTHAIVTGMTGSGKTGLCIALLEEAALQGIPA
jgi:polynucleotide 5'-kinase involved in rRNA processing